jgi:hypothetical protein
VNAPIQSLWVGRLSTLEQLSISSFLNNGHPFHLYVYDEIENVPEGVTLKNANEVLPLGAIDGKSYASSLTCFSNLFRYELLYRLGGYWVDLDVVCFRPWDFVEPYVFAAEHKESIGSEVLRVPAGAPIMKAAIECVRCVDANQLKQGMVGPVLLTKLIWGNRIPPSEWHVWSAAWKDMRGRFAELATYVKPPSYFVSLPLHELPRVVSSGAQIGTDGYGVHLWNTAWRWFGMNKDRDYPADCLYEQLKRRYGVKPCSASSSRSAIGLLM